MTVLKIILEKILAYCDYATAVDQSASKTGTIHYR